MPDSLWRDRLRERLAAEGSLPSEHSEAVDEIAQHLDDIHRHALAQGHGDERAMAMVEDELTRIGPLANAIADRARRRRRLAGDGARTWGAGLAADLRGAGRALRLNPGFSAIVILTLAVGIGACTAVFSVINAVLWASLPYPQPQELMLLWETNRDDRADTFVVAYPNFEDWKKESRSFSAMGLWEFRSYNLASEQQPEQVPGVRATAGLFAVLGVPPALGRVFTEAEEAPGHRVVVIGDAVWRSHFNASANAIGARIRLNGEPFEVIGVMPAGFEFPRKDHGIWVPFGITEQDRERGAHSHWVAGRLKPGVTFDSARAEIEQIGRSLAQAHEVNRDEGATVTPMAELGLGRLRTMLTVLMSAVALVLVIACANVANLQLGRALSRRREFVLRLSLGASLGRLARQLFAEALVLASAGAIGAVAIAVTAAGIADRILSPGFRALPFRGEVPITIDGDVLMFAGAAALCSAAIFGFAPLLGLRRRDPAALLRDGERGSTGVAHAARRALVAVEVALAIVVLCGAGLLIKSLAGLLQIAPGLEPRDVLTAYVSLPQPDTYGPPVREMFCADLARAAEGMAGVHTISAISHLPLSGANAGRGLTIEGRPNDNGSDAASAAYRVACPAYFSTLQIPFVDGRDFTNQDVTRGQRVAIVNRAMADAYWPGGNALGKRFKLGDLDNDNPWIVVAGIVENVRHFGLDSEPRREFFVPYAQSAWPVMTIVAKTASAPAFWQTSMREVVRRIDPQLPVAGIRSMSDVIGSSISWRETPMRLLTGFSLIGLLLAALGVYGVLAYYVSQRTREIGVRAALGATRSQLAALVIRQSLAPITAGAIVGIVASFASGRLLQELLYQVQPGDPQVIGAIVALFMAVGILASWLPARRAAAIDPIVALRDE